MGERFGDYELLEKIAVGGMAEIYKARAIHGKGVEKTVVIKRIHPALCADKNFISMFIEEARLGVNLVHGNIVPVFDFGQIDGNYYLAMEYVNGENLAALAGRAQVVHKPWSVELAVYVVCELLEGLEYSHNKKDDRGVPMELVHRDISPSNILVSKDGQVKMLDFGIAHSTSREFVTKTGVIKGKPGYMSPEQAAGHKVDRRADVWSAGAVLYELLTGHKLKDGRQTTDIPELELILHQALAANPMDRFQSAKEMNDALHNYLFSRGQRPTATSLGAYVDKVLGASAPTEDWSMRSHKAEHHIDAVLKQGAEVRSAATKVGRHNALTPAAGTGSDAGYMATISHATLKTAAPRGRRHWWLLGTAALLLATAVLALVLLNEGGEEPSEHQLATNAQTPTPAPAVDSPGTIAIDCTPAGTDVVIDGNATGKYCPASFEIAPGPHTIALLEAGFRPWQKEVTVAAGQSLLLNAELLPAPALLTVTSEPASAAIAIDGRPLGPAPVTATELKAGTYTITAKLPGHRFAKQQITVAAGDNQSVSLRLKKIVVPPKAKAKKALLSVNSRPWSHVTVDGKVVGTTPITELEISPGKHTIELNNPVLGIRKKLTVNLAPGEKRKITELLKK